LDVQEKRQEFIARMKTTWIDRLVFLDESGSNISMAKSHGWALKGARLHDHKPANWGDNLSTIGAIRCTGTVCHQTVRGAVDTPKFIAFIRDRLCPRLRPGDIVVLDNLKPHKHPLVRELVEDAGGELLLMPPYSPDLNPIELCWSWVKRRVKELAARTVDNVRAAIRSAFRAIPKNFFGAWYEHCGYRALSTRSSV
jgi:transposase